MFFPFARPFEGLLYVQMDGRRSAGDVGEYSMEVQGDGTPKKIDGKNEELIAIGLYP